MGRRNLPETTDENVLGFIHAFNAEYGHTPSVRDIADRYGISVSTALERIRRLERNGFITRKIVYGQPRIAIPA